MINFGYSLTPSSTIEIDDAEMHLFDELCAMEPDAIKCMSCGSCAASCTAGVFTDVNLRKVLLGLQRGEQEDVLPQLKSCMLCGKCYIVCPRGINTRHLILSICKIYNI
ncbi:MAG TPA: 4Fe-4S dicluster domain-containing protein [Bacteroidales bacterium]|jgi:heterodisulfide reductase subunit C|nr:4Fe-4S dicluster domain-containing protein [Bacteroidales bacterium]HPB89055.1 4Fe-4S dicluster domain-containing protein [Bacteroidales bacterium]HPY21330.1 4Fe-4S dicluster domain-containing protein [Bacteroidales bacterium]HQA92584.1 4Fe-4S dicluster domain-containing protein [Bacteroidales bacterium]HQN24301.1 4Fe-4S dicluster domain-containing protein [Bacteroidales bacterium]